MGFYAKETGRSGPDPDPRGSLAIQTASLVSASWGVPAATQAWAAQREADGDYLGRLVQAWGAPVRLWVRGRRDGPRVVTPARSMHLTVALLGAPGAEQSGGHGPAGPPGAQAGGSGPSAAAGGGERDAKRPRLEASPPCGVPHANSAGRQGEPQPVPGPDWQPKPGGLSLVCSGAARPHLAAVGLPLPPSAGHTGQPPMPLLPAVALQAAPPQAQAAPPQAQAAPRLAAPPPAAPPPVAASQAAGEAPRAAAAGPSPGLPGCADVSHLASLVASAAATARVGTSGPGPPPPPLPPLPPHTAHVLGPPFCSCSAHLPSTAFSKPLVKPIHGALATHPTPT